MGGIFASPPPPPAPAPAPQPSKADIAAKAARERRRRAQGETIATSWRGLADTARPANAAAPKRLLGD
ncbi:MAG TPA: hypothetical protein VF194_12295 [Ferrovibrio sp.]|uniref:hypothetical protein n=1 Tax=Ferrovibrio sp. TaxID=1917215 RepID=UPI002ED340A8